MVVQCGDFVVASERRPLDYLIWSCFANELLAGEPKDFPYVAIGFRTQWNRICGREQNFPVTRRRRLRASVPRD